MDETPDEKILRLLAQTAERQKLTARAVGDVAVGLNTMDRRLTDRLDQVQGVLITLISEPSPKKRRRDTPEHTDKFKLPAGVEVQAPRETTRKFVEKLGKLAFWLALVGLTHAAHCLAAHEVELVKHPAAPPSVAAPAER